MTYGREATRLGGAILRRGMILIWMELYFDV